MKILRSITAVIIAACVLFVPVSNVFAQPPVLPSSFWGTVKINSANVPAGTIVSAWINGVQYSYTEVIFHQGETFYSMNVPGDIPGTPGIEGGVQGNVVQFRVNGRIAQPTGTWQGGTNQHRDLTLTAAANTAPVITEGAAVEVTMSKNGSPTPFHLTLNATDVDATDTLSWTVVQPPAHGTAAAPGTGFSKNIQYAPNTGYTGSDSFTVQVTDGVAADTITVNVEIEAGSSMYLPLILRK